MIHRPISGSVISIIRNTKYNLFKGQPVGRQVREHLWKDCPADDPADISLQYATLLSISETAPNNLIFIYIYLLSKLLLHIATISCYSVFRKLGYNRLKYIINIDFQANWNANCFLAGQIAEKEKISMLSLNKWIDTVERIMTAVTFAEAGDHITALKIMQDKPANRRKLEKMKVRKRVDQRPVLRA
jgi:hypothetical protein